MTQKNRRHAPFRVLGCQIPALTRLTSRIKKECVTEEELF